MGNFGLIGGDRRQAELARLLAADGHTVQTYGLNQWNPIGAMDLERVATAETVILPLPLCKDEGMLNCAKDSIHTLDLFQMLKPEQRILAGQIKPQQYQEAAQCGLNLKDYFQQEELTVANAAATAEAAIQVTMEQLDRTLLGMECLVLGFGRIGKLLSYRLHGLGAWVTATARRAEDLAWIRAYGWRYLRTDDLDGNLNQFGVVFNTIPSLILQKNLLSQLQKGSLCVDLASKQGVDQNAADALGIRCIWARALPGRLVPCTAAEAIRDTIEYILLEGDPL